MRNILRGYSMASGLVVVALVVITGALGYVYITRLNSQVASTHTTSNTTRKSNQHATPVAAPAEIASSDDLDTALSALESTPVDDSSADLASIQTAATDF